LHQKNITIKKTARYFVLGEPSAGTEHVWFICHGYGHLANYFLKHFEPLNNGKHLLVAPEGLHRFYVKGFSDRVGASWMTKEDRLDDISDYVNFLDDVHNEVMKQLSPGVKVNVLGFSQGAATVTRWLCMGGAKADHLILWAGAFPPDIDYKKNAHLLSSLRKWVVIGDQDEFIKQEQLNEHIDFLREHGLDHELIVFSGKHEIQKEALLELEKRVTS
jgi:predicted esterase